MAVAHTDSIEWPNGLGWTPCSREYRETMDARDAIWDIRDGGSTGDLSPEDYNRWHMLDMKLDSLHASGHIGKSERY